MDGKAQDLVPINSTIFVVFIIVGVILAQKYEVSNYFFIFSIINVI